MHKLTRSKKKFAQPRLRVRSDDAESWSQSTQGHDDRWRSEAGSRLLGMCSLSALKRGKVLHAGAEQSARWSEEARDILLAHGWEGIAEFVRRDFERLPDLQQRSVKGLLDYLAPHQYLINYAGRLREGLSIGSGQIEGACKNLIGRRIKANAARWKVRRANRMAGLCSIMYRDHWKAYWQTA